MIFLRNKKRIIKVAIFVLLLAAIFGLPYLVPGVSAADEADAGDLLNSGSDTSLDNWGPDVARWIITLALQLLQSIAGFVLGLGMALVDLTLSDKLYDQVFFAGSSVVAINTGWGLVRDFVNMFFILILIFVAIATILRVNKFSDKKFIVYVVSAALFVNFSKPITMFIIDISNLAMSFFMSNIREGNASYASALLNAGGMGEVFKSDTQEANTMGMLVAWVVEIVFKFIMGIMLLALGLSLIVRLIALWVLIILSPMAFFAIALPGTAISKAKSTWLNKLTYWCFYGPVMLFFFWLALVLVSAIGTNVAFGDAELQMAGINKDHFIVGALKVFIPYASCIYMLFYGFSLSKSMASSAGDGATWGLGKAGAIAKGVAYAGTAGYGFGYGKAAYSNMKESYQKSRDASMLQKKATMGGGNLSAAQHKSNLVDETTKEWDKEGTPDKDRLKKIMATGTDPANMTPVGIAETRGQVEAKRKAAAIQLAEKGELKGDQYARAMGLFKNDQKNLEKFEKAAKKKNRREYVEYKVAGKEGKDEVERKILKKETDDGVMSKADREEFRGKATEEVRKEMYEKELKDMKLPDIMDQSSEFLNEKHVKDYLRENTGASKSDKRFTVDQIRKQAAENLDETKQKILAKERFFASGAGEMSEKEERDALRGMSE